MLKRGLILIVVLAACAGPAAEGDGAAAATREDLPSISVTEFEALLANLDQPAVINVWASWCIPCRAEAPLLNAAFAEYGDRILFIGIDVQDTQAGAKAFLAEFGLEFQHYFDPNRAIANRLGGIGVPNTFFFGPGGELINSHLGILDERTLALNIDELLKLDS
jgi:cytochrome c biogenesis protein CcmG/thiol:disulfide interchange protein DsbE